MASADILFPIQPSEENYPADGVQSISGDADIFQDAFPVSTSTPDLSVSTTTTIAQIVNASVFGESFNGTHKIDLQVGLTIFFEIYNYLQLDRDGRENGLVLVHNMSRAKGHEFESQSTLENLVIKIIFWHINCCS